MNGGIGEVGIGGEESGEVVVEERSDFLGAGVGGEGRGDEGVWWSMGRGREEETRGRDVVWSPFVVLGVVDVVLCWG